MTSAGHLIGTHLVDVKVVDDGVKTGVEVVEQRHHLQRNTAADAGVCRNSTSDLKTNKPLNSFHLC